MLGLGLSVSSVQRGGPPPTPATLRLIANRNTVPTNLLTTNHSFNSITQHVAAAPIEAITLALGTYTTNGSNPYETGHGHSTQHSAAIEYPQGTLIGVITFSGAAVGTCSTSPGTLISDLVTLSTTIPAGATFYIRRWYWDGGTGGIFLNAVPQIGSDRVNVSATQLTDLTQQQGTAIANNAGSSYCAPPLAIVGYSTAPAVIALGDSITWGLHDTTTSYFQTGIVCKALSTTFPFLNLGSGGLQANNVNGTYGFNLNFVERLKLLPYCSTGVIALGRNDYAVSSRTAAQIETDLAAIVALFPTAAKKILCTLTPSATSTDNFVTLTNQTTSTGSGSQCDLANTAILSKAITGQNDYFDTAGYLNSSAHSGMWTIATLRTVTDAAISASSNILTSATANFTAADVGNYALVTGAAASGAVLKQTISSVTNSTTVVLGGNASTTVTGATCNIGPSTYEGVHPMPAGYALASSSAVDVSKIT